MNITNLYSSIHASIMYLKYFGIRFSSRLYVQLNIRKNHETNWYFVVHGETGIDKDNLKNAAREYISQNSDKTNWDKVYPELYSENEFIIVPLW